MRKSIQTKMLLQTQIPILLVFIITAILILNTVQGSMETLTNNDLTARSSAAAYQVGDFFTKYTEITRQMSINAQTASVLASTTDATLDQNPDFEEFRQTLTNIAASDTETILYSWIVDVSPSQYVQSDGPSSAVGEWDVTTSSWYQQAADSDDVVVTEPYLSTAGSMVISVVKSVTDESGKLLGFVAIDISTERLSSMMAEYRLGETGFFMLASKDGMLMHYPDTTMIGKNISETGVSQPLLDALTAGVETQVNYEAMGTSAYGYVSPVGDTGWMVATGLPEQEYSSSFNEVQRLIFIVFLIGVVLLGVLMTVLAKGIVGPLKKLSDAANKIAEGELDVAIDVTTRDETGQVADALKATVLRLKEYINYIEEISQVLNHMAAGGLAFQLKYSYSGEFQKIEVSLKNISAFLSETIGSINRSSDQLSVSASQVSDGATGLSQGATEQAAAVEELAATISDISNQVNYNAGYAGEASQMVGNVKTELERSNLQMQQMIGAMSEINIASGEISKIIKTIEGIAFQTNILSLNAAVESARAGVAGQSFGVVADEVRNLAAKSSEAVKNITELIERSIKAVENGTSIASHTAQSLIEVVVSAEQVTEKVTEIARASTQQASSIAQVTQGIDQISSVVQANSATAEESAASSDELSGQAQHLKDLVGRFKL